MAASAVATLAGKSYASPPLLGTAMRATTMTGAPRMRNLGADAFAPRRRFPFPSKVF
jgi:hypothetical protein